MVSDRFLDSLAGLPGRRARAGGRGGRAGQPLRDRRPAARPDPPARASTRPTPAAARGGEDDRFEHEGRRAPASRWRGLRRLADADPGRWRRIDADPRPRRRARRRAGGGRGGRAAGSAGMSVAALPGTEDHPQARMVLSAALAGAPSHAYLFHGPAGTGKRTAARAFAAELLAEGVRRSRVGAPPREPGTHPDLTWVRPTRRARDARRRRRGARWCSAATRTPFEASRRVFVLERVDTMNDEVANRLLKTLEEPASFVHLILLTDSLGRVLDDGGLALPARALRPAAGGADRGGAGGRGRAGRARAGLRAAGARQRRRGRASWPPRRAQALRADVERLRGAPRCGRRRGAGAVAAAARARRARRGGGRGASGRGARAAGSSSSRRAASGARSSASSRRRPSATAAGRAPRCSTWR